MSALVLPKGVELLPSGAYRGRFTYRGKSYRATFDTPKAAAAWIQRTRRDLAAGIHPDLQLDDATGKPLPPLFADYSTDWLATRDLKPSTRAEYTRLMPHLSTFNPHRLDRITRAMVRDWHKGLKVPANHRAHIYALLRVILNSAVKDDHIAVNPCRVEGAGRVRRRVGSDLPTPAQVHQMADAMGSEKYRVLLLVSAWAGLRFGEATELRRKDVVLDLDGTPLAIRVRRGVTRVPGDHVIGTPKSAAGVRDVAIPPHIRRDLAAYLGTLPKAADSLLFPGSRSGAHMAPSSLYKPFYRVRAKVGLPQLRWHDLRHFSATTAAGTGATIAELQARLGHSTAAAAMRYQHAAKGRDAAIAAAMSAAAGHTDPGGTVVQLRPAREG